jgi:hypothetical protein
MSINKAKTRHKNALFTGVITGNEMSIIMKIMEMNAN